MKKIKSFIRILKPSKIAIFTDGQALIAKIKLQIKRRLKYLYTEQSCFNTLNFTPGTPFMDYIDETIICFLQSLPIDTYYSSSKENNEGNKDISLVNGLIILLTIRIVGDDSDIVLLALACEPLLNIHIY